MPKKKKKFHSFTSIPKKERDKDNTTKKIIVTEEENWGA